jgi:tRNA U34 5-methylaminomethyl-2-thiouridine-forming methyltransferase MnmC
MNNVKVIFTKDGSKTLHMPEHNEQYHSIHGAINEAEHVFIKNGLRECEQDKLTIFEMGFGTALNAFMTYLESKKTSQNVRYYTIENNPLPLKLVESLEYPDILNARNEESIFSLLHTSEWNALTTITPTFELFKISDDIQKLTLDDKVDLVYYDAFGPRVQADLWTERIFSIISAVMKPESILVTYCAKGEVKRILKRLGFVVETLTGPPGKREMVRAKKIK